MLFKMTSENGVILSDGLDEHAPCIRLKEGEPSIISDDYQPPYRDKKPLKLDVGESCWVTYPLHGLRSISCLVTRTE